MIAEVRGFAPLRGYRNLPRGDLQALAAVVSAVSALALSREIAEAELNPVLVRENGVVAVDALVVRKER
jgi:succinyl-CoA synthetase beta subunit